MRYQGTELPPIVPSRKLGQDNQCVHGGWPGRSQNEIESLVADAIV